MSGILATVGNQSPFSLVRDKEGKVLRRKAALKNLVFCMWFTLRENKNLFIYSYTGEKALIYQTVISYPLKYSISRIYADLHHCVCGFRTAASAPVPCLFTQKL